MQSSKILSVAAALTCLVAVNAQIQCQVYNDKDVVCAAGSGDYVLQKGLLSDNNKITTVTLKNCRITSVDADAFDNDSFLNYVDLAENKLTNLNPALLDSNVQVTFLNLSYNAITDLPAGLFNQKPNLEVLDLKGNKLTVLQSDIFVPLRKLYHLDLSANTLSGKDIDPYLFGKNRKIKFLDLSNSVLSDAPENILHALTELQVLNLDSCQLTEVPACAGKPNMRTLTHLVLSNNQITRIDIARTFVSLEKLNALVLRNNMIESIIANAFMPLKNLRIIDLAHNKLRRIADGFFRNLAKLERVDISNNQLEIIPMNAFRGTALQVLNLSNNRFSYLDSYFVLLLRNSGVNLRQFYIHDNPWQCACLNEVLVEMKSFQIEYDSTKYDGLHGVCVTTKMFTCKRQYTDNQAFIEMYNNVINGNLR